MASPSKPANTDATRSGLTLDRLDADNPTLNAVVAHRPDDVLAQADAIDARIARGEDLGYGDPEVRGHSLEFRINGEDAGRGFMPAPGTVSTMTLPTGPGVRVDSGITAGEVIGGNFDSMLAKLIVTGATREQAIQRANRALAEMDIGGMPTVLPFHRAVVADPAFAPTDGKPFTIHTRWIETEFNNTIPAFDLASAAGAADDAGTRQSVTVEVGGKRLEVTLPSSFAVSNGAANGTKKAKKAGRNRSAGPAAANGNALTSPMQGTIVKVAVADGDVVAEGDLIVVLEAMKMEQPLTAHRAGTVTGLNAAPGDTVSAGAVLATIED